jgi:transcription-repair coupling factor (superfamily II helicase)
LRQRAALLGIRRFELGAASGVVEFGPDHRVAPDRVVRLVQRPGGRYRLDGPSRLRLRLEAADASARIAAADSVLDDLGG